MEEVRDAGGWTEDTDMNKVCVFAGTTEGRKLVEFLSEQPICVTACVATEYGEALLPPSGTAHVGRMDRGEMEAFLAVVQTILKEEGA